MNLPKDLFDLLDEAEQLAGQFSGGYSNRFSSADEFHQALTKSITELKQGNTAVLYDIWIWFAPTCDWDDFIGRDGQDLANKIYSLLCKLVTVIKV